VSNKRNFYIHLPADCVQCGLRTIYITIKDDHSTKMRNKYFCFFLDILNYNLSNIFASHILLILKSAYGNHNNCIINAVNNNSQCISLIFSTSGHSTEMFHIPMSIYPASKCGVIGLTTSLRNEMRRLHLDIKVTVCL